MGVLLKAALVSFIATYAVAYPAPYQLNKSQGEDVSIQNGDDIKRENKIVSMIMMPRSVFSRENLSLKRMRQKRSFIKPKTEFFPQKTRFMKTDFIKPKTKFIKGKTDPKDKCKANRNSKVRVGCNFGSFAPDLSSFLTVVKHYGR